VTRLRQAVRVVPSMVAVLLAGCGSASGPQPPSSAPPPDVPHSQRMLLPLSFSLIAMGSPQTGWALSGGPLETRDAGTSWIGVGRRVSPWGALWASKGKPQAGRGSLPPNPSRRPRWP